MGIDDLADKAKDFVKSDKVEEVSDGIFDAIANAANKVTGGRFESQIDGARDAVDAKIGNDGAEGGAAEATVGETVASGTAAAEQAVGDATAGAQETVDNAAAAGADTINKATSGE
jgi:hypothetical protein